MLEADLVDPLDSKLVGAASQSVHRGVQRQIPRSLGHVHQIEIRLLESGEDSGHQNVGPELPRRSPGEREHLLDLPLHVAQTTPTELHRLEVELEIESSEFGRETRVVERLDHRLGDAGGAPGVIDQEELLLRADPSAVESELPILDHDLEGAKVGEKMLHEGAHLRALESGLDVLRAHRSPSGG